MLCWHMRSPRLLWDTHREDGWHSQGTTQQLAAAAALNALNWRFHTQHRRWYQRPCEPHATPQVRPPARAHDSMGWGVLCCASIPHPILGMRGSAKRSACGDRSSAAPMSRGSSTFGIRTAGAKNVDFFPAPHSDEKHV